MARSRSPSGSWISGCASICSASFAVSGARQTEADARQLQLRSRVVQDVVMARHPFEPHAERNDAVLLLRVVQRLAVLLAVMENVPLAGFEHRARDFGRLGDAALFGPFEEETHQRGLAKRAGEDVLSEAEPARPLSPPPFTRSEALWSGGPRRQGQAIRVRRAQP